MKIKKIITLSIGLFNGYNFDSTTNTSPTLAHNAQKLNSMHTNMNNSVANQTTMSFSGSLENR